MRKQIALLAGLPFLLAAGPSSPSASREASSRAEWTAKTRHVVNRRFSFAEIHPEPKGSRALLLEETFDRRFDTEAEGEKSTASVEAFALPGEAKLPLWKLETEGAEGSAEGELYRVTRPGCCGAQNLDLYFSLREGRPLFASDGPILKLEVPNTALRRYVGYHSLMAATPIPEAASEKDVIGVLTFGGERGAASRLLVVGRPTAAREDSARKGLMFVRDGKVVEGPLLELWSSDGKNDPASIGGFSIRVTDFAKDDFLLEVAIAGDHFDLARARTAPGVRVKGLP